MIKCPRAPGVLCWPRFSEVKVTDWFNRVKLRAAPIWAAGIARVRRGDWRLHWDGRWPSILRWTTMVFGAFVIAIVATLYFMDWNSMRGPLGRYASARLGREVRIDGNLDVHIFRWSPLVEADDVKVVNPSWLNTPLAADIRKLTFEFRLIPFLFGNTILPLVEIDSPDIQIVRDESGRSNWDLDNGGKGAALPPINRFVVRDGKIGINDRIRKLVFLGTVSSEENADKDGANAFSLTGKGKLNREDFVAEVHGGPLLNVDASKPYGFTADIHSGATHVVAAGAITKPFNLGQFSAAVTFSGSDLADLYDLTGLTLPGTPPYKISGHLTRDGAQYQFADLNGIVGDSDLQGQLSVDATKQRPFLRADLKSKVLDFKDLGPIIGQKPSLSAKAAAELPDSKMPAADTPTSVFPDVPLQVGRVRQMDAEVDYKADTVRSRDFPLREVSTHVSLNDGVLVLKPLTFAFGQGRLAGSVQIDARGATPVTDLDARITEVHLEQFIAPQDPPIQGQLEAHAKLHGVGDSVYKAAKTASGAATIVMPRGKIRAVLAELTGINLLNGLGLLLTNDRSDVDVRCAVVHFNASNGLLTAQQFVIDTEPVLIKGGGQIDFSSERMNLSVSGKPKEFRLGRVRAPITISGPLSHPAIGVAAGQVVAQGGIAAALAFLFPVAAILPFVDPGLEKDANCVGLLADATTSSAPVKTKARTTPAKK